MSTIEKNLKSRLSKARLVALCCWLLFVLVLVLPLDGVLRYFALLPFLGMLSAIFYLLFFIRCPRCSARIGQSMTGMAKVNYCPSCGLDLNTLRR